VIEKQTTSEQTREVQDAIFRARRQIDSFEQQYARPSGSVALMAVSKTKPVAMIRAAIAAGQRDFGENYLDEALLKIAELKDEPCTWHFIGQIQSNKTASIASHFDWVHGIDREKIATRLSAQRPQELPPLDCCIQLNIDQEATKAGITPDALPALCQHISQLPRLRLRGLMCIPAPRNDLQGQRQLFNEVTRAMHNLQESFPGIDTLSMGMSGDLEAAIAEGSTMVRLGTALFGARA